MSRSTLLPHLALMYESAQNATSFVQGMDEAAFLSDAKTQAAVSMCLINIGEAARTLATKHREVCEAHPQIEWGNIVGLRNRIAHDYSSINFSAVWETLLVHIPPLLINLKGPLEALGYRPSTGDH